MEDNTTFFVKNLTPQQLKSHLADICNLAPSVIIESERLKHKWQDGGFYRDKVFLEWHQYEQGDLDLEIDVVLGGRYLSTRETGSQFTILLMLSLAGECIVMTSDEEDRFYLYNCGQGPIRVYPTMPEEYAELGPALRD